MIQIPGYRVIKPLGEGGMASVYLAEQVSLERLVALKVMSAQQCHDIVAHIAWIHVQVEVQVLLLRRYQGEGLHQSGDILARLIASDTANHELTPNALRGFQR